MLRKTTFTIYRLQTTVGEKRDYVATSEKIFGILEPMDAEFSALAGNGFGKSFRVFSSKVSSTVAEGDKLKTSDGKYYTVKGVIRYDKNLPRHIEIMCELAVKQT